MDWLFDLVIKWFVGYIAKVGATIDFNWFRNKVKAWLAPLPDFLEIPLVTVADSAIDALQAAFKDEVNLKELLQAIADQDWPRAFKELEELLGSKKKAHASVVHLAEAAGRMKVKAAKAAAWKSGAKKEEKAEAKAVG